MGGAVFERKLVSPEEFRSAFELLSLLGVNCTHGCCRNASSDACPLRLENPGGNAYGIPETCHPDCLRSEISMLHNMFKNKKVEPLEHYLHCSKCGKIVSTQVPKGTIVRAYIECPECAEREL